MIDRDDLGRLATLVPIFSKWVRVLVNPISEPTIEEQAAIYNEGEAELEEEEWEEIGHDTPH